MTGRRPFEHTHQEPGVIQKVLAGSRPEKPTVGFSDPLWTLLNETWLEEHESSSSVRPDITTILEQLQDEAKTWSPTNRVPAPPIPMERKTSGMPPSEPGYVSYPKITVASSVDPYKFPYQLVQHTGVFPVILVKER